MEGCGCFGPVVGALEGARWGTGAQMKVSGKFQENLLSEPFCLSGVELLSYPGFPLDSQG